MKNPKYQILNTRYLLLFGLFLVAFVERVLFDFGPNIELVTMAMILTSFYFGKKESFWLTFTIIALSDIVIGNSNIFLFTWSGFLIPAIFSGNLINKLTNLKSSRTTTLNFIPKLFSLTLTGLTSNLFFFLWTNFGVWFLDSWNMYPDTTHGLILSYVNALPFLKYQLTSTLGFVPLGFLLTELAIYLNQKYQFKEKFNQVFSPKFKVI